MISAVVLAAGESRRMGQPKMLMQWGETTVIGKVISVLLEAGVIDIAVVTGGLQVELEKALSKYDLLYVYNNDYKNGEMLTSIQVGLKQLSDKSEAALVVLGDQPQIQPSIVGQIIDRYHSTGNRIIVPSFQMHRGHPWLVEKSYWPEIKDLRPPETLRSFLSKHGDRIDYIPVDSASILQDLDSPGDYNQFKP